MKLLKPTYLLRTLLLLCAVAVVSSACERNETQSLSDKLDHMIANRQVYDCQKEQRIAELRHLLSVSGLTPAQEYEINDRLFGEFHKYKLDSAIRYMERNVLLARRLGDRRKGCLSGIRLAELYSSTGMSIEAKRMLDSIDRRSVPRDMLATYYKAYNRFYRQYVAFSGQRHFRELEGTLSGFGDHVCRHGFGALQARPALPDEPPQPVARNGGPAARVSVSTASNPIRSSTPSAPIRWAVSTAAAGTTGWRGSTTCCRR